MLKEIFEFVISTDDYAKDGGSGVVCILCSFAAILCQLIKPLRTSMSEIT